MLAMAWACAHADASGCPVSGQLGRTVTSAPLNLAQAAGIGARQLPPGEVPAGAPTLHGGRLGSRALAQSGCSIPHRGRARPWPALHTPGPAAAWRAGRTACLQCALRLCGKSQTSQSMQGQSMSLAPEPSEQLLRGLTAQPLLHHAVGLRFIQASMQQRQAAVQPPVQRAAAIRGL